MYMRTTNSNIEPENLSEEINLLIEILKLDPRDKKTKDLLLKQINRHKSFSHQIDCATEVANPLCKVYKDLNKDLNNYLNHLNIDTGNPKYLDGDFDEDFVDDSNGYFLYAKRERLLKRLLKLRDKLAQQAKSVNNQIEQKTQNKLREALFAIFDVGKKFIDLIDDLWNAIGKSVLSKELVQKVTPYLVGPVGAVIHFAEACQSLWAAIKAIKIDKTRLRKTKIVTGITTAIIGGAGTGLGISYIAGAAGATVLGYTFMPALIPGLLTIIYSIALIRNILMLRQIKKEVMNAEKNLPVRNAKHESIKKQLKENTAKYDRLKENLANYRRAKEYLTNRNLKISEKIQNNQTTDLESKELIVNNTTIEDICAQETSLQKELSDLKKEIFTQRNSIKPEEKRIRNEENKVEKLKEKQRKAEREIAFKTIEVLASMIVVVGTILGTATILAALGVATMGAAPIALLVTGVSIGVGLKIFEKVDEKKGHKYSDAICNWFKNLFTSHPKPVKAVKPEKRSHTSSPNSTTQINRDMSSKSPERNLDNFLDFSSSPKLTQSDSSHKDTRDDKTPSRLYFLCSSKDYKRKRGTEFEDSSLNSQSIFRFE